MTQFVTWFEEVVRVVGGQPFLLMVLAAAPLVLLGYYTRSYPSKKFVVLATFAALLPFLLFVWNDFFVTVLLVDGALLLLAVLDLFTLPRAKTFAAERETGRIVSLKKKHRVSLTLSNLGGWGYRVEVRDGLPQEFTPDQRQFNFVLRPRSRATLHYEMEASRRGAYELSNVYLRAQSRLGLWWRYQECPVETTLNVYPDMKQIAEYELLARSNRLSLLGVRRTRRIGQDHDFERLRDYTRDDNPRHIDWRSSARRNKLTVKDYQSSQSQRLIFLIDSGRMMTNEAQGLSLLDHSLNAMLMLSYIALKRGDSVGLISFSDQIHSFVPPKNGLGHMNRLLHASFDRFPRLVESRYDLAFLHLAANCRKRSLVILVTNVIDDVNATQIEQYLSSLTGRHLPLGVLLRDHRLFDAADQLQPMGKDYYRAAAAAEILTWRHQALRDLHFRGVLALDVFPEEMTAPLINKYLEVKARHLL